MSQKYFQYNQYPRGRGTFVEIPRNGFDNRYEMSPIAKEKIDSGLVQEKPPPSSSYRRRNFRGHHQGNKKYGVLGGQWSVMYTPGDDLKQQQQQQQQQRNIDLKPKEYDTYSVSSTSTTTTSTEDMQPFEPMEDEQPKKEQPPRRKRREVHLGEYYSPFDELPPVRNNSPNNHLTPPPSPKQELQRKKHVHAVGEYYSPFGPLPPLRKMNGQGPSGEGVSMSPPFGFK